MKSWTIIPLFLGKLIRDKSFMIHFTDPGVKTDVATIAWLLVSENQKIIVDTGPSLLQETAEFHQPFFQTPEQTLEAQLSHFDILPDEIEIIINTHLHWDHCYQNSLFRKARFFVQKRELEYAHDPLPLQRGAYEVGVRGVVPPFSDIDFEILDGDTKITSGVEVILSPGHSPGMQTVCVHTLQGPYIIAGDTLPLYENIRGRGDLTFLPNGIYVDLKEYYESVNRIQEMDGYILPGHDMHAMDKKSYP